MTTASLKSSSLNTNSAAFRLKSGGRSDHSSILARVLSRYSQAICCCPAIQQHNTYTSISLILTFMAEIKAKERIVFPETSKQSRDLYTPESIGTTSKLKVEVVVLSLRGNLSILRTLWKTKEWQSLTFSYCDWFSRHSMQNVMATVSWPERVKTGNSATCKCQSQIFRLLEIGTRDRSTS